jgi:cytochrome c biogenesis protein CcmG, thiol:disulfide interchange protein DsbE
MIRPLEHVVEFNWSCLASDRAEHKTVHLPVVPGALFARLDGHHVRIESARGLARAYYTWVTESERLESGSLALASDSSGVSRGFVQRPASLRGLYLVVSSSPDGRSPSTVGYPLDGQGQTFDAIDGFLLDGAAEAQTQEERRLGRVRRALLGYVAALFSLALLLFRALVVASDRQLLGAFELNGADAPLIRTLPRRPLFLGGAAIALGLSLVLVWLALWALAAIAMRSFRLYDATRLAGTDPAPQKTLGHRDLALYALGLVLLVLLLAFLIAPYLGPRKPTLATKTVPAFDLPLISGGAPGDRLRSADLRGRPVLIDFWASWCGPCKDQARELEALLPRLDPQTYVLGISTGESEEAARAHLKEHSSLYSNAHDADQALAHALNVTELPTLIVLDAQGKIVMQTRGPKKADELVDIMAKLGQGPTP